MCTYERLQVHVYSELGSLELSYIHVHVRGDTRWFVDKQNWSNQIITPFLIATTYMYTRKYKKYTQ